MPSGPGGEGLCHTQEASVCQGQYVVSPPLFTRCLFSPPFQPLLSTSSSWEGHQGHPSGALLTVLWEDADSCPSHRPSECRKAAGCLWPLVVWGRAVLCTERTYHPPPTKASPETPHLVDQCKSGLLRSLPQIYMFKAPLEPQVDWSACQPMPTTSGNTPRYLPAVMAGDRPSPSPSFHRGDLG